jgi:uncharacterized membrane protein
VRLLLPGLFIILAGIILVALGSSGGGSASTGGFILIGPIPIVFGSGPGSSFLAALAVVVGLVLVVLTFVYFRRVRLEETDGS